MSGSDHELQGQQEAAYTRESFSICFKYLFQLLASYIATE